MRLNIKQYEKVGQARRYFLFLLFNAMIIKKGTEKKKTENVIMQT